MLVISTPHSRVGLLKYGIFDANCTYLKVRWVLYFTPLATPKWGIFDANCTLPQVCWGTFYTPMTTSKCSAFASTIPIHKGGDFTIFPPVMTNGAPVCTPIRYRYSALVRGVSYFTLLATTVSFVFLSMRAIGLHRSQTGVRCEARESHIPLPGIRKFQIFDSREVKTP